jgi:hypothetical protein
MRMIVQEQQITGAEGMKNRKINALARSPQLIY